MIEILKIKNLNKNNTIELIKWLCENFDDGDWQIGSFTKNDFLDKNRTVDNGLLEIRSGMSTYCSSSHIPFITIYWNNSDDAVLCKLMWDK